MPWHTSEEAGTRARTPPRAGEAVGNGPPPHSLPVGRTRAHGVLCKRVWRFPTKLSLLRRGHTSWRVPQGAENVRPPGNAAHACSCPHMDATTLSCRRWMGERRSLQAMGRYPTIRNRRQSLEKTRRNFQCALPGARSCLKGLHAGDPTRDVLEKAKLCRRSKDK